MRLHLAYAGTTLGVVFVTMGAFLLIRALCIHALGLETTGIVDAAFTISGLFTHAFLVPVENYWFSRLASNLPPKHLAVSLNEALRLVTIGALLGVTFAIAFRNLLIAIFYTSDFFPASQLLRLMLIGDFLRVTGWVLRVCLLARGDKKGPLFAEIMLSVLLVGPIVAYIHVDWEIVGLAYVLANAAWLVFIVLRLHRKAAIWPSMESCATWVLGFAVVLIASAVCWTDSGIELYRAGLTWIVSVTAFLVLAVVANKLLCPRQKC
jgi:hypothetical protein